MAFIWLVGDVHSLATHSLTVRAYEGMREGQGDPSLPSALDLYNYLSLKFQLFKKIDKNHLSRLNGDKIITEVETYQGKHGFCV